MQHAREELLRLRDYSLHNAVGFLAGQLQDLAREVDHPHHLLLVLQHLLADVKQTLQDVAYKLVVIDHLADVGDLDAANAVQHHQATLLGAAENAVRVDCLELLDFVVGERVLRGDCRTWNWCLKAMNSARFFCRCWAW